MYVRTRVAVLTGAALLTASWLTGGVAVAESSAAMLSCDGLAPTLVIAAPNMVTMATNNADVVVGTSGNDTIIALAGNDTVCGGDGNDDISGGAGDDRGFGEEGDDDWRGGPGADFFDGGPDRTSRVTVAMGDRAGTSA